MLRRTLVLTLGCLSLLGADCGGEPPVAPPPSSPPPVTTPPAPVVACPALSERTAGTRVWFLQHDGLQRSFRIHVPEGYTPERAWPVVLNFHGYTSNAEDQQGYAKVTALADEKGFIAVLPEGVNQQDLGKPFPENERSWSAGACCGIATAYDVDDVGFVGAVLDAVAAEVCVDPHRVFATGFSNGGFLSHRLACEYADRIAAVAPVAGVNGMDTCAPSRPVPVMQFHGTSDGLVPYEGNATFPSVADTMAAWAERNGCDPMPAETFHQGDTLCQTWSGCEAEASVVLCTIDGGGHTWPGGTVPGVLGKTTQEIDASRAMWDFFSAHPLR